MKLFNKKRPAFTADRLLKPLRLKGGDFVFQLTVRDARFALLAHRKLFFADFHFVSRLDIGPAANGASSFTAVVSLESSFSSVGF